MRNIICCFTLLFMAFGCKQVNPNAQPTPDNQEQNPLVKVGDGEKSTLRRVRMIYLVSFDREENVEYTAAIEHAIRDLQNWYGRQLSGPTFRLSDPVVEVVKSNRPADWFYGNPNGNHKDNWGFNNTLDETRRLLGVKRHDPQFVWAIYSDGPGNKGAVVAESLAFLKTICWVSSANIQLKKISSAGSPVWATNSVTPSDYLILAIRGSTLTRSCGRECTVNIPTRRTSPMTTKKS